MSNPTSYQSPVIKLNAARLSFPVLFVAKPGEDGGKPKFAATFLLDKKIHSKEIAEINKAITYVKAHSPKLVGNKRPVKNPLREGSEKEHLDGYNATNLFITGRNEKRPGVVDRQLQPLAAEDGKPYAGCYVNATVECYGYVHPKSGPGVTFSLRNVQFVRDGEPFGEKRVAADKEFAALPDEDGGNVDSPANTDI